MKKKPMSTHGLKTKARKLLSQYLKEIAQEKTELVKDENNEDQMATKAEALARKIWNMALGWSEVQIEGGKPVETHHAPDKAMMMLVFDRTEGKVSSSTDGSQKLTTAKRVTEQSKNRLNELVE